jgi:hypothetical protein
MLELNFLPYLCTILPLKALPAKLIASTYCLPTWTQKRCVDKIIAIAIFSKYVGAIASKHAPVKLQRDCTQ